MLGQRVGEEYLIRRTALEECHYVKEDSVHSFYLLMATIITTTVIRPCSRSKQIR